MKNLDALPKHNRRIFKRISVDLDSKDRWELYRVTDWIEFNFGRFPEVRETTKGYHIWINLKKNHSLTIQEVMELRMELGDDPLRISFDMCWAGKGWTGDALFVVRRGVKHYIERDRNFTITGR